MEKLIDPWREHLGNRGFKGGVEPFDTDRIYGGAKSIPYVPQRVVKCEVVVLPPVPVGTLNERPRITARERINLLIRDVLKERHPHISFERVMGSDRRYDVVEARRDCIKSVKLSYPTFTGPQIARIFGISNFNVFYALHDEFREKHRAAHRERKRAGKAAGAPQ